MACVFHDHRSRITLLEMARVWQWLADHREQPAMQQQQQIQPDDHKKE